MTEQQQYEKICSPAFSKLFLRLDSIDEKMAKISRIEKRLFEDNGVKSIQTKINENTLWCSAMKWFVITTSSGFILGIISMAFLAVKMLMKK